jgi:thioredoxin
MDGTTAMDVTTERFERDVLERSHELPVVVDFWAAWCGPCRMLGPVLEREAESRAGEFALVKVDVDANQELALRYQIQGIPAVKAFRDGQVVREFVGALPPAAVAQFLDELTGPTAAERLVAELEESGELPDVVEALEQDEHERALELLLEEISAADGERRERLLALSVRRPRPRASAHGALPAAARRHALLMAAAPGTSNVRPKEFHFPVTVEWLGERRVAAQDHVTTGLPWQRPHQLEPRRLVVAAAASCLAVTFTGLASRAGLAYTNLNVERRRRRRQARRRALRLHAAVAPTRTRDGASRRSSGACARRGV